MKLLIFDLDGTIADTKSSVCEAVNMAMEHFGKPSVTPEDVEHAMGNGAVMLIRRLLPEADRDNDEFVRTVYEYYDRMYDATCTNAHCYEGMKEAIAELKGRGYKIAVLSNKQDRYTKKLVGKHFSDSVVDFTQGQTDLPKKPDPAVPLMIAERFGISPGECAFIGDSDVDVLTAKNAGMVGVACAWGYRPESVLEALSPEWLIHEPAELCKIFG